MSETKPAEPPARAKRGLNQELQAMAKIDRLLGDLTMAEAERVVEWLSRKYGRGLKNPE